MKKILKSLMVICLVMVLSINVDAVCNDTELNDFVEKLKIEFMYPEVQSEYAYYFTLSEDKYKGEGIEKILYLEALDGAGIPGEWKYQDTIKRYGVGGYTNLKEETYTLNVKAIAGKCEGETLKHELYTIPQFNRYIQTSYCEKYPEYDLCKRFTNETNGMSDNEFATKMKEHEREIKNENTNKFLSLVMKYYSYILCVVVPVVIISIYFNMKINRFKKLRNREETRYNNNKKGLFIFILFFVMLVNVNAASTCDEVIQQQRTGKSIPGTQVAVYHWVWDEPGEPGTFTTPDFNYEPGGPGSEGSGDTYIIDKNDTDSLFFYHNIDAQHATLTDSGDSFTSTSSNSKMDTDETYTDLSVASYNNLDSKAEAVESYGAATADGNFHEKDGKGTDSNQKNKYARCVTEDKGGQAKEHADEVATWNSLSCTIPLEACCTKGDGNCYYFDSVTHERVDYTDGRRCTCGDSGTDCSSSRTCNDCHITSVKSHSQDYSGSSGYSEGKQCPSLDAAAKGECESCASACTGSCTSSFYLKCPTHTGSPGWNPVTTSSPGGFKPGKGPVGHWEWDCVDHCDPEYELYCVNPDSPMNGKYQVEYDDPAECASSNSSVDCGYLNILVEAQYNNKVNNTNIYSDAVNLATRFWGAYTQQGGYFGTGMGYHANVIGSNTECTFDSGNWGDYHGSFNGDAFASCYDMLYLGEKGKVDTGYMNIYKQTVKYILSPQNIVTSPDKVLNGNIIDTSIVKTKETYKTPPCKINGLHNSGVICGDDEEFNLRYAIALFYNTKQGNPDFQTHLNKLYKGLTATPIRVVLSDESDTITDCTAVKDKKMEDLTTAEEKALKKYCDTYGAYENDVSSSTLSIEFKEQITHGAEYYDCEEIAKKLSLGGSSLTGEEQEELERINEFCKVEVKVIRVEADGGIYEYEKARYRFCPGGSCNGVGWTEDPEQAIIGTKKFCGKGSCQVDTKLYAPCGANISRVVATIAYRESKAKYSIKRYTSCSTTGSLNPEEQYLYSIASEINIEEDPTGELQLKEYNVELPCKYDCNPSPKISYRDCEAPEYDDFVSSVPGENSELEYSNRDELYEGTFKRNVDIKNSSYGKSYESSIKDPSLSCILNSSPTSKQLYDYSDHFGVNDDICRVYCSDEVHYFMAEKTLIYSGLSFKYDIEYGTFQRNTTDKSLSSIIQMRRNCVSEIYFDNLPFSKDFATVAKKYGIKNYDKTNPITNWSDLYTKVLDNAVKLENNRNDLLNKLIYDLYNCNFLGNSEINANKIARPSDDTTGSIYDDLVPKIYGNNYGFENCTINDDTNDCITLKGIEYEGGTKYAKDSGISNPEAVGDATDTVKFGYTLSSNTKKDGKNLPRIGKVYYCKNKKDPDKAINNEGCFDYIGADSYIEYNEKELTGGEYALPDERCKGGTSCGKIAYVGTLDKLNNSGVNIYVDGAYITNEKVLSGKKIPKNDYAYFTITTEVGFYNDSKFATEAYTGDVYDLTEEKNKLTPEAEANLAKLSDYSYPATITTDECDLMKDSQVGSILFSCDVKSQAGPTGTYHRNFKTKSQDKFYKMINDVAANVFSCYYVNNYFLPEEVVYRNVKLSDMFPSANGDKTNRIIGENWRTQIAQDYRSKVETYAKDNGDYDYYQTHLEYSYTLDQNALDKIREYNSRIKDYKNDDTIQKGVNLPAEENCDLVDNKYLNCKSTFISEIEKSSNQYGVVNNRSGHERGKSEYTASKEREGN